MRPILALLATAAPAAAHTGAHLHPHDGGSWLLAVGGLAVAAAVAFAVARRK